MAKARKGTVVDERYVLGEKVGTGGMADVWKAHDKELDRDVAIKILHDRFAQDNEFVERFKREAQAAAGLQHPNVVSIFDRGAFRDTYFIAMEYVDGPQLKELVKGGMSSEDAMDFTRQILNAARFAHRKGIIHRDLKPQNVMIDEDGRARVTDFGIARAGASDITGTGSVMGTAQYLSPEQAQGKETTERSDIYSIGVILYEALTGRVPFEGDSAVAVALKQVSEQPRRPSAVNPKVPPALDAVVMRALAKDPDARFINADAFLKALDAAEQAPDQPRPEDTAAFAAVAPDGTPLNEEGEEWEGYEEPGRRPWWHWALVALLVAIVAGGIAYFLTNSDVFKADKEVPSVTGQEVGVATELLESEGFDVDIETRPNAAPRDTVTEQDPIAGETIKEGSTIVLTVSTGPATVEVPNVQGLTEKQARDRLDEGDFEVTTTFRANETVPEDRVVGTEPAAGTPLQTGASITLIVSQGSNRVEVPSVVGQSDESALSAVSAADLNGNVVQRDDDAPAGQVVGQSPSAGQLVKPGSQVTIFVSSGAISVPDVVGDLRKTAVTDIKKAGFTPQITESPVDDPNQVNRVTAQFPPAGSRGQRGDVISITVGTEAAVTPSPTPTP